MCATHVAQAKCYLIEHPESTKDHTPKKIDSLF